MDTTGQTTLTHELWLMDVWPEDSDAMPELRHIECPICHRAEDVDWALVKRGDYYCDGSDTYQYRVHRIDRPGLTHVFNELEQARHREAERRGQLLMLVQQLTELSAQLGVITTMVQEWTDLYMLDAGGR